MPLSKYNIRFTILAFSIGATTIITVVSLVILAAVLRGTGEGKILAGVITAFAGTGIGQLCLMLRAEQVRVVSDSQSQALLQRLDDLSARVEELTKAKGGTGVG